jgi:hypothetical protein
MAKKKIVVKQKVQPVEEAVVDNPQTNETPGFRETATQQAHDAMRNTYTPAQLEQNPNLF